MFDMKRAAGDNAGYQLRINYNNKTGEYYVAGFIVHMDPRTNVLDFDRDGNAVYFKSLQACLTYIESTSERN